MGYSPIAGDYTIKANKSPLIPLAIQVVMIVDLNNCHQLLIKQTL